MSILRNLYDGSANIDSEGQLRIYKFEGDYSMPVICVRKYNEYVWVPFEELSSILFYRYREGLNRKLADISIANEADNNLAVSMFKTMTVGQRQIWLQQNEEYKNTVCTECGIFNITKTKCLHYDCPGMCSSCFLSKNPEGFENCACCGQKQESMCPICQEVCGSDNLVQSEECSHHICWSCFGRSVKSSCPISHCPLCRSVFCEKLVELTQDDFLQTLLAANV